MGEREREREREREGGERCDDADHPRECESVCVCVGDGCDTNS